MNIIKKLPKIYQNSIDKKINNNRELYYSGYSDNERVVNKDIGLLIDGLFNNEKKVYNIPVIIDTSNKSYDTYLVARTKDYILTINRDKIPIDEIISIKIKNP